jgi:hypothetical protein
MLALEDIDGCQYSMIATIYTSKTDERSSFFDLSKERRRIKRSSKRDSIASTRT